MKSSFRATISCTIAAALTAIYFLRPDVAATENTPVKPASNNACIQVQPAVDSGTGRAVHQQVLVRGGEFTMGHDNTYPEERPARREHVSDFYIDTHEVTNSQFRAFVEATNYITTAELQPDPSLFPDIPADVLVPGSASFIKLDKRPKGQWRDWWKFVPGANWRQPNGPGSDIDGMGNYPVVHVSYRDAQAYADWADRKLPTEAQWEYAAQASMQLKSTNGLTANTWQGFFPHQDKALDGFDGIAPVGCFQADKSGLFDMRGNVWELVADVFNPQPVAGHVVSDAVPVRVIKGGSYLCADNHCQRDRPQARQGQEEDFSTDHVGFRTVSPVATDAAAQ